MQLTSAAAQAIEQGPATEQAATQELHDIRQRASGLSTKSINQIVSSLFEASQNKDDYLLNVEELISRSSKDSEGVLSSLMEIRSGSDRGCKSTTRNTRQLTVDHYPTLL